jgi:hypothetical protein
MITPHADIAESSPGDLLWSPHFWMSQKGFIFIVVLSLVTLFALAPYTYDYANGWVMLTLIVQGIGVWGMIFAVRAIARIEVETAIVAAIESRGSERLRAIHPYEKLRVDLDQLEQDILPVNIGSPPPAMIRLFQHICKEARDRKFESSVNVIQPYREESLDDIFRLQNLQKIALWLGIAGTFIGLLRAIQIGDFVDPNSNDLMQIVRGMLNNLFISFSASLAGLETAVILGLLILLLRKKQERYFQCMETSVVTMLSLARNAVVKDDFLHEFRQANDSLVQVRDVIDNQNRVLTLVFNNVRQEINKQSGQIQNGIDGIAKARTEFDGFLKEINETQREFIRDMKSFYDAISLKTLGTTLQGSIIQAGKHISDTINPQVLQISAQLAEFNKSIALLNQAMNQQTRQTSETVRRLEDQIRSQQQENIKTVKAMTQLQHLVDAALERINKIAAIRKWRLRNLFPF